MPKTLVFGQDAKEKLLKGVNQVNQAVASTLGPKANNVAIERPWGTPSVLHDGVSIAKEIQLPDSLENLGAALTIEAAAKTNDQAGDGTTTATILTQSIFAESLKNIAAGANPMILRKGIEKAVKAVMEKLKSMAKPVVTNDEIKQIATISAQDEKIGNLIAGAMEKLGKECVITVEEAQGLEIEIEYKEGMEFSKGYISPYFMTDKETGDAVVVEPNILITDANLSSAQQFIMWVQQIQKCKKERGEVDPKGNPLMPLNVVIIAPAISDMFLTNMVLNKMKGQVNFLAIQAPDYGDRQKEILQDLATITGGQFISSDFNKVPEEMVLEDFGHAKRIISTRENTVIVDGAGTKESVQNRVTEIKNRLKKSEKNEFEKEKMEERLAKLTSGIAVINVGAPSEAEMREKKERCIDAINATKAAKEEGIVVGGELALIYAGQEVKRQIKIGANDEEAGVRVVLSAVKKPFQTLMANSGYDPGQMLQKLEGKLKTFGIDVIDGQIKDMLKSGIVDPVKVTRSALQNASSTAIMLMLTDTLIVEKKEENKDAQNVPSIR